MEYASLRGTMDGMDPTVITEIARYFEKEIGYEIPPRTPFVGRDFNVTRAGIHADGLLKDEEIYNIFNTELILNRPASVAIDAHSGLAGVAHWLNASCRKGIDKTYGKRSNAVIKIKEMVDAQYAAGRNTTMSDEELCEMVRQVIPALADKF